MPGGRIRPVVSVPGKDGDTELLPYDVWLGPASAHLPVRQAEAGLGPDLRGGGVHRGPDPPARVTTVPKVTGRLAPGSGLVGG